MYITVSSSDSLKLYPDNNASSFKVQLNTPIPNKSEVGLAEISYINKVKNVPFLHCTFKETVEFDNGEVETDSKFLFVEAGFFKDIFDLIKFINKKVSSFYKKFYPQKDIPLLFFDQELGRCVFGPFGKNDNFSIVFPQSNTNYDDLYKVDILGFQSILKWKKTENDKVYFYAGRPPTLHSYIFSLYLYSDMIQDTRVGNVEAKLLRTVPIKGHYKDNITIEFKKIYYHKLVKTTIDNIEIQVRDDTGALTDFEFVSLVLHFK